MRGYVIAGSALSIAFGIYLAFQGDPSRTWLVQQVESVFGGRPRLPVVVYGSPPGARTVPAPPAGYPGGEWREPPRTLEPAAMRCAVTRLADGDTFSAGCTPGGGVRIRVRGVDTPERGEARYDEARLALDAMLRRCDYRVTVIPHHHNHDRIVGDVMCGSVNVGQAMDAAGWSKPVGARR